MDDIKAPDMLPYDKTNTDADGNMPKISFKVSLFGYNRKEVQDYLLQLESRENSVRQEMQAEIGNLQKEINILKNNLKERDDLLGRQLEETKELQNELDNQIQQNRKLKIRSVGCAEELANLKLKIREYRKEQSAGIEIVFENIKKTISSIRAINELSDEIGKMAVGQDVFRLQ